jgi:alkylation response protein AidB-like acyl-CoA dehydrogenase
VLTEEQLFLRKTVRELLAARGQGPNSDRAAGHDRELWSLMAQQIGMQGLAVPEEFGGAGAGPLELAMVFEELGAVLSDTPFFATVALAATALQASGDRRACADYLPRIASGELVGTIAFTEADGRWDESELQLPATRVGAEWLLSGSKRYVVDGAAADVIVVAARTQSGVSLFLVEAGARGLRVSPRDVLDPTRPLADITLAETPARLIGAEGAGWEVLQRVLALAATYLAAEQVGGAARCLDLSVEYAKTRVQFGRPIGSFQAIKHKCADMLVAVEMARSAALAAAAAAAANRPDARALASLAKATCSESFVRCATDTIQVHGGIGFTWEHPAHLYYKRARSGEVLLGSPAHHRDLLAQSSGELPV